LFVYRPPGACLRPLANGTARRNLVEFLLSAQTSYRPDTAPPMTRSVEECCARLGVDRRRVFTLLGDLHNHFGFGYRVDADQIQIIIPTSLPEGGIYGDRFRNNAKDSPWHANRACGIR
jgi:hypothetical protein